LLANNIAAIATLAATADKVIIVAVPAGELTNFPIAPEPVPDDPPPPPFSVEEDETLEESEPE